MKRLVLTLSLGVMLIAAPLPVLAHKIIAGVFPAGDVIEGEIAFSSGEVAVNQEVTVTAPDGTDLGRAVTDADGFFVFTPTEPVEHIFRADLGAGHVALARMSASDVGRILGVVAEESRIAQAPVAAPATPGLTVAALSPEEKLVIAEAVRDEIRPLRREMTAWREESSIQDIIGGIGYIAGLFGLGFYLAARRKLAAAA